MRRLLPFCLLLGCGVEDVDDLGWLDKADDTRETALELGPGDIKRYRVKSTGFVARLMQSGEEPARLSAKHLELEVESAVSAQPALTVAGDGTLRLFTLRVENLGDEVLSARLHIGALGGGREIGVVSDIDKTVLPPETAAGLPPAYPGVAALYTELERHDAGDVYYVTARTPDGIGGLPEWMEREGLPAGPIETGISTLPWVTQPEKVRDISRIFAANPDQRFVLFGDTSHRDPEVYREILDLHPTQVAAVFVHKVNRTVDPARVADMHLVESYAQASAILFGLRLLDESAARAVMAVAMEQGLAISAEDIDALIDSHRP